ncbi:hypothetical protein J2125_001140 [Erwinia toletana]|uniref:Uncharacterized protein n=1 Tax=Winslowiella toletana TaxID=92490 RepID=A0ABS4P5P4_9GAMM|nr:hypothetical protein [Winslowiella toletana]
MLRGAEIISLLIDRVEGKILINPISEMKNEMQDYI